MTKSPDSAREKRELRRDLRAQRLAMPASKRMQAAEAVAQSLLAHPRFALTGYVAGYWAMAGEVPLHVLQMRLRDDQIWCLPCVQADGSLRFAPWRPGDSLVSNQYGIPEPDLAPESQLTADAMTVILVPLLGFTRAGQRLGMGGGYYDRSLGFRQAAPAPPLLLGIGYAFQERPTLPRDAWDLTLDLVATERDVFECTANG